MRTYSNSIKLEAVAGGVFAVAALADLEVVHFVMGGE